jgi:hypothetical protein
MSEKEDVNPPNDEPAYENQSKEETPVLEVTQRYPTENYLFDLFHQQNRTAFSSSAR